ncbi:MAG: hypothetical protein LBQ50_08920, partial [Planctomycetaceae bacterium]|nr:hypothetical protein [Planctomycetaceae bacterium]
MDDAKKLLILITGIFSVFAGCSLTVPVERLSLHETTVLPSQTETVVDPFLAAIANEPQRDPFTEHLVPITPIAPQNVSQNIAQNVSQNNPQKEQEPLASSIEAEPSVEIIETPEMSETVAIVEKDEKVEKEEIDETIDETEETESVAPEVELVSDEEQERILSKDMWTKNIVLDYWKENEMKDPFPNQSDVVRKRRNEISRLNMSEKEIQKQKKFDYEYSSGLPSTWRWFHRDIEQLAKIPSELRGTPEIFLHDKKYQGSSFRVLRANAVILMGRDGDPLVEKELIEIVQNQSLKSELRCAAAET